VFSWVLEDLPVALFGVSLSVVLAGFAGAMAIVSFLPAFETRRKMWSTVMICTLASSYLTKLVLHYASLDGGFALAVGFGVGFVFQLFGTGLVQYAPRLWEAALARIRGSGS
jgi:hypothetical protein